MKTYFKFLACAMLTVSSVSFAQDNAKTGTPNSPTPWLALADQCWKSDSRLVQANIWQGQGEQFHLTLRKLTTPQADKVGCHVEISIPVTVKNEQCDGINTLAFMANGRSSFALGNLKNIEGQMLGSVFTQYKGKALGLAVIGGVGRWAATSRKGITIEDKIPAIPIPAMGGNIALGYTSCKISFELLPASNEATVGYSSGRAGESVTYEKTTLPLSQILSLPLL